MARALGFVRRQVVAVVLWQAAAISVVALLAGVALGRVAWTVLLGNIGLQPEPVVPARDVILVIAALLVTGGLISAACGGRAARTRPAAVLHAE